jgi:hypothetical protein
MGLVRAKALSNLLKVFEGGLRGKLFSKSFPLKD